MILEAPEPGAAIDFDALDERFEWVRALRGVPQDPVHHAEGDVWIHTRMVLEALVSSASYAALDATGRSVAYWAALLHDVAKPECTREEGGRITARGHSRAGACRARVLLYRAGVEPRLREAICAIVAAHQIPFFAIEREDGPRLAIECAERGRNDWLACVTEADARGRKCNDQARLLDNVELFREQARELDCLDRPHAFASASSRFMFFKSQDRLPREVYDDTRFEVTLMSGLPASGKSTWIATHAKGLPIVSLDALREELDVSPGETQGVVVQEAQSRLRAHLRREESVVVDATLLLRTLRRNWVDLCAGYGARARIVHVEVPLSEQARRNRARVRPVPERIIENMIARWEPPDSTESHALERVGSSWGW